MTEYEAHTISLNYDALQGITLTVDDSDYNFSLLDWQSMIEHETPADITVTFTLMGMPDVVAATIAGHMVLDRKRKPIKRAEQINWQAEGF